MLRDDIFSRHSGSFRIVAVWSGSLRIASLASGRS